MTNQHKTEKRKYRRFLCNENFSDCVIFNKKNTFTLSSINFHREGMSLFTTYPIREMKDYKIGFSYTNKENIIQIDNLPICLCHCHETDAGSQYGVEFLLENSPKTIIHDLVKIETLLEQTMNTVDRYGILKNHN